MAQPVGQPDGDEDRGEILAQAGGDEVDVVLPYQALMAGMRSSIASGTMDRFAAGFLSQYRAGE